MDGNQSAGASGLAGLPGSGHRPPSHQYAKIRVRDQIPFDPLRVIKMHVRFCWHQRDPTSLASSTLTSKSEVLRVSKKETPLRQMFLSCSTLVFGLPGSRDPRTTHASTTETPTALPVACYSFLPPGFSLRSRGTTLPSLLSRPQCSRASA